MHTETMNTLLQLLLGGTTVAFVSSCGNLATSQNFDPANDPLDSPGRSRGSESLDSSPVFAPGTYVEVTDANAGLFGRFPSGRGNVQPDSKLEVGSQLKVVSERGSYLKVVTESGQIGFVPTVMVSNRLPGSTLVPLGGLELPGTSVDPVDSEGLPPLPPAGTAPFVAPDPEIPPISVEQSETPSPAPAPAPAPGE